MTREIPFFKVNEKGILTIVVENETKRFNQTEVRLQWKTFSWTMKNAWTVISKQGKDFHISPLNAIGTKMKFFEFATEEDTKIVFDFRKQVKNGVKIDKQYFGMWLSIFLDTNLDETWFFPYLWKLKEKTRKELESILEKVYNKTVTIQKLKDFYYLDGLEKIEYWTINDLINEAISENNLNKIFSFILWIYYCGFAKIHTNGIVFQIPIRKLLTTHYTIVENAFEYLKRFFVFSLSTTNVLQISSKDGMFEQLFIRMKQALFQSSEENEEMREIDSFTSFIYKELEEDFSSMINWKKLTDNLTTEEKLKEFILSLWVENPYEAVDTFKRRKLKIHTK